MPSAVPSRLAAAYACVLALGLAAPAQADKQPGKTPPPGLSGLVPPGQTTSGGSVPASPQAAPPASTPASGGAPPGFTQKENKSKGAPPVTPRAQKPGGQGNYNQKQQKPKDAAPSSTPATTAAPPTPITTPAGGSTPAPTTPATPGGGSLPAPAPKRHKPARHGKKVTRHVTRTPAPSVPRAFAPVSRAVGPAPLAKPSRPAASAPKKRSHPVDALAGFKVSTVTRTVRDIVQVIPLPVKALIGAMAALLLAAIAAWTVVSVRARRLRRQRGQLLQEVGLLQAALLPEVPDRIGPLAASVAYRPADGPGAGGDFYDVFQLDGGKVGLVLGDVAGHGRDALARTALLRYTLRAYLETGLEPRIAMRLAGDTLEHNLGTGFATAAIAVYDPAAGTLTYSCAGHPPPILLGPPAHEPVTACSAPPIGVGERTGIRQTSVPLPPGSIACFFTDGLAEARIEGELFGRDRLADLIAELGPDATASELIERIRVEVHHLPDDMAACVMRPLRGEAAEPRELPERVEELELRAGGERDLRRFLAACGIPPVEIGDLVRSADARYEDYGGAIVRVRIAEGRRPHVSLVLPLVESLATAGR